MPTIRIHGYRFRFYSSDRFEPPHVHVIRGDHEAKIRLTPVAVESSHGYNGPELNRTRLLDAWNAYFAG